MKALVFGSSYLVCGFALVSSAAAETGSMKMTQADCQTLWKQLDANSTGSVPQANAQPYAAGDFKGIDLDADGKLSSSEFQKGCESGMMKSTASTGAGAGSSGSSSSGSDPVKAPDKK